MILVQHSINKLHFINFLSFVKCLHFLRYPTSCSPVQNSATQKFELFALKKLDSMSAVNVVQSFQWPHGPVLTNSSLTFYPWPITNVKELEDPNLTLILTMKLVNTNFWWTLPEKLFVPAWALGGRTPGSSEGPTLPGKALQLWKNRPFNSDTRSAKYLGLNL